MKKILVCLFLLLMPISAIAKELQARNEIENLAQTTFLMGDFDRLNEIGSDYLKNKSRTSSGLWKISLFFSGFSNMIGRNTSDPERWRKLKTRISKWTHADKEISFSHLVYVDTLIAEAFEYRGDGWAHTVRPKDWKPFFEKIEEASLYMEKINHFKNSDPNWYLKMLTIAKVQQWSFDDFYQLLDEALSAYPQYYPLYFGAIAYLQPRWNGSTEEIEKFATYATKKSEAHEGQGMYARIYWFASQLEYENKLFTRSNVRWSQMKSGINDVLERYPDQWNIQNFAYFSCLAKDRKMTRKLMGMLEGKPIMRAWKDEKVFRSCENWAKSN